MKKVLFLSLVLIGVMLNAQSFKTGKWKTHRYNANMIYDFQEGNYVSVEYTHPLRVLPRIGFYEVNGSSITINFQKIDGSKEKDPFVLKMINNSNEMASKEILTLDDQNQIHLNGTKIYLFKGDRTEVEFKTSLSGNLNYTVSDFNNEYIIQHYRFKKWTTLDTLNGNGKELKINDYQLELHSELNRYRILLVTGESKEILKEFEIRTGLEKVKIASKEISTSVVFSSETYYELYTEEGLLITKGKGKTLDMSKEEAGIYFLAFDDDIVPVAKN